MNLTPRQQRWLDLGVYGSLVSPRVRTAGLDTVATLAANWAIAEWKRRTKLIEDGHFDANWGDPAGRVSWSDVSAQLNEAGALDNPNLRGALLEACGGRLRIKFQPIFTKGIKS